MTTHEAGRELDALIAEHVFGGPEKNAQWYWWSGSMPPLPIDPPLYAGPQFSTDIAAAWTAHLAMCDCLFSTRRAYYAALQEQTRLNDGALVAWPDVLTILRDRMPKAICLAALEAVGVSVPA